jgi:stage II sporulation protein AB (anti-sigma F factor)
MIERGAPIDVPYLGFQLPAVAATVPEVRGRLRAFAAACGADAATQEAIELAVTEAVTNAIVHGYPGQAPGMLTVDADFEEGAIELTVTDDGIGFVGGSPTPGLGLGLGFMRHHSSGFEVRDCPLGGVEVWLRFPVAPSA